MRPEPFPELTVAQAPRFTDDEAQQLARDLFRLDGGVAPLPSERDQNFLVSGPDGPAAVLKIANAAESEAVLDLQNRAIEHLARSASTLAVPRLLTTADGSTMVPAARDGQAFFVRALTYVPGTPLAHVRPHSRELLRGLGARLGDMDRALASFEHPAMRRDLHWDLKQTARLTPHLPFVEPKRRARIAAIVQRFSTHVAPRLASLRSSVIHNDWNDYNVLVNAGPGLDPAVTGAIDFGDLLHSHTVCDLAIAIAYAMLGKPDPIAAAADVVRGYHSTYPLTEDEIDLLFDLVQCRLATSVVMAARQRAAAPDNAYLGISQTQVWEALEALAAVDPSWARYAFRNACGLRPCPASGPIVNWLRAHQREFAALIAPDPRTGHAPVVDLSVGHVVDRVRPEGVQLAIGRYDEARLAYRGTQFERPGNDGEIVRTVHVGLDFFADAGTPVFAPLDGVVHSFRNNAGRRDYGPTIVLEHRTDAGAAFFTLYGHLNIESLEGLFSGKLIRRGEPFAAIGETAVNGGWPPHLHFQIVCDMLGQAGQFPGVVAPEERDIWLSLSPDPNLIAGLDRSDLTAPRVEPSALLRERADRIGPSLSVSYRRPLTILRGLRQYLYDAEGRAYLDAVNNVPHVGHCHPRVVRAGQAQMAALNTNTRYLHPLLTEYAGRLTATLPPPLSVCFFVNSGSEANELALRIARAHTRGRDVIVLDGAYHGNTSTLVDISPYKFNGPGGGGRPDFVQSVRMPDPYRHGQVDHAADMATAIDRIHAAGHLLAAFFCESLLSCGGQIVLPDGYLADAYRRVRAAGGVCVADEVQVGMGRVGTHFWGFQTQDVVPDIVVLGKPIGNGHPLGAVVTTPELAASFANGMEFFSTFGGNPVSCAIGLAVLDVIRDERLQLNALTVGRRLIAGLDALATRHPLIGDVRGRGLFIGIELVEDRDTRSPAARQASYVVNRMRDRRILVSVDGPLHNVIKIKPPLVFTEADADRLVETLDDLLGENGAQVR